MIQVFGAYGVSFNYPGGPPVLADVTFELAQGEILSLFGPNGSGKSTLLKLAAGLLPMSREQGRLRCGGTDFLVLPPAERVHHVTYVPAELTAEFPITAEEAVMLGRTTQGRALLHFASDDDLEATRRAMEECRCWELRDRELHSLSSGERQLVTIARALTQGSRILLLDESLSRMDLHHQSAIGKLLRRLATDEKYSFVLVSHDVNLATEWADAALLLSRGRTVTRGKLKDALTEAALKELYPNTPLKVAASPTTGKPKVFFG